jgi:hypothetical protein
MSKKAAAAPDSQQQVRNDNKKKGNGGGNASKKNTGDNVTPIMAAHNQLISVATSTIATWTDALLELEQANLTINTYIRKKKPKLLGQDRTKINNAAKAVPGYYTIFDNLTTALDSVTSHEKTWKSHLLSYVTTRATIDHKLKTLQEKQDKAIRAWPSLKENLDNMKILAQMFSVETVTQDVNVIAGFLTKLITSVCTNIPFVPHLYFRVDASDSRDWSDWIQVPIAFSKQVTSKDQYRSFYHLVPSISGQEISDAIRTGPHNIFNARRVQAIVNLDRQVTYVENQKRDMILRVSKDRPTPEKDAELTTFANVIIKDNDKLILTKGALEKLSFTYKVTLSGESLVNDGF